MINMKYRTLQDFQTPIDAVAWALDLAYLLPSRNKAQTARFLGQEIVTDAGLTDEDFACSKAIAIKYLWGGENNE